MVYRLRDLIGSADCASGPHGPRGAWVRSIPIRLHIGALNGAWAVLRGEAVAVRFPVDGELEEALADTGGINVPPKPKPLPLVMVRDAETASDKALGLMRGAARLSRDW